MLGSWQNFRWIGSNAYASIDRTDAINMQSRCYIGVLAGFRSGADARGNVATNGARQNLAEEGSNRCLHLMQLRGLRAVSKAFR
jgi:hypothetical protein